MRKAYKEQKGDAEVTRGLRATGSEVFLYDKGPGTTGAEGIFLGILPSEVVCYYHVMSVSGQVSFHFCDMGKPAPRGVGEIGANE